MTWSSWLETTVTGPGVLGFQWSAALDFGEARLRYTLDGVTSGELAAGSDAVHVSRNIPPGTHTLRWELTGLDLAGEGAMTATVDAVSWSPYLTCSIAEGLDTGRFPWSVGGDLEPFCQTVQSHDDRDSVVLPGDRKPGTSWFEAPVSGPGTVSFWWRVDAALPSDVLRFLVDGLQMQGIGKPEAHTWRQITQEIPAGQHLLRWEYLKIERGSIGAGEDRGWVDGVFWNTAPTLGTVTPSALTSAPGAAQSFRAVYSDADGLANLKRVLLLVNTTASGVNGISLAYSKAMNRLYLYDDAGTATGGNCTPGAAGSLSNSQGTLNCAATTVAGSGNDLTVNWSITPSAAFASAAKKNLYLSARDLSDATAGWTDRGDWTISPAAMPQAELEQTTGAPITSILP